MPNPSLRDERDAKLQMVLSISRSQNALARILESIADVSSYSEETALSLAHHVECMTRYQQAMASMLMNIPLNRQYSGIPSAPWLNPENVPPLTPISSKQEVFDKDGA